MNFNFIKKGFQFILIPLLFFFLILNFPINVSAQNPFRLKKVEIAGLYSQFGTGGKEGFGLSNELFFGKKKKYDFVLGIRLLSGSAQYDSPYEKVLGGPRTELAIFRTSTSILQLDLKPTLNFTVKKVNLSIGVGPLISYRSDTNPANFTVFFPLYTKLPDPIYIIEYPDLKKYKTFEAGIIGKSTFTYAINTQISVNLGLALQIDSKDLIWQYPVGIGISF